VLVQDCTLQDVSARCAEDPGGAHLGDAGISIGSGSDIYVVGNSITSTSLDAAACTLIPPWASPGTGIQWSNVTTLVIQDNVVRGGFRDAIASDSSPNLDENVDIVGNTVSGYKDDGPEAKGGNVNVRIWDNHILADVADTCIAGNTNTTTNRYGPLYVFRNVCRVTARGSMGATVFKLGGAPTYVFHNSVDASLATGVRWDGFVGVGDSVVVLDNAVVLGGSAIDYGASGSVFDHDVVWVTSDASFAYLWNGASFDTMADFCAATGQEAHGLQTDPGFVDADLRLGPGSAALDRGVVIPNFDDLDSAWPYAGSGPDAGAWEL
jgi:hypothetical protein